MLKNLKEPFFTVFGMVGFFKRNNFRREISFSHAQHVIPDFLKTGVFSLRLFLVNVHRRPANFLQKKRNNLRA